MPKKIIKYIGQWMPYIESNPFIFLVGYYMLMFNLNVQMAIAKCRYDITLFLSKFTKRPPIMEDNQTSKQDLLWPKQKTTNQLSSVCEADDECAGD